MMTDATRRSLAARIAPDTSARRPSPPPRGSAWRTVRPGPLGVLLYPGPRPIFPCSSPSTRVASHSTAFRRREADAGTRGARRNRRLLGRLFSAGAGVPASDAARRSGHGDHRVHRQAGSLGLDPTEIALAGDSADANLAFAAAAALRDRGEVSVALAVLFYGMYARDSPSHRAFGGGEVGLTTARMRWFWDSYLGHLAQRLDSRVRRNRGAATDPVGRSRARLPARRHPAARRHKTELSSILCCTAARLLECSRKSAIRSGTWRGNASHPWHTRDTTSYEEAATKIVSWGAEGGARAIAAANVHMLIEAADDAHFRNQLNRFDIITPDGMPSGCYGDAATPVSRVYTVQISCCTSARRRRVRACRWVFSVAHPQPWKAR
jgi:alpha/beta hydrolase fold